MPIYEFYCQSCGHEFEKIVSFSQNSVPDCPACASAEVGRRMSRPAIHFKGSGWYITDSRKGNGKHTNNGDGDRAEKSTGKDAEKSEGSAAASETNSSAKESGSKEAASEPAASKEPAARVSAD